MKKSILEHIFAPRLVSSTGRSFDGSRNGLDQLGIHQEDSSYSLPLLEKITVRFSNLVCLLRVLQCYVSVIWFLGDWVKV